MSGHIGANSMTFEQWKGHGDACFRILLQGGFASAASIR